MAGAPLNRHFSFQAVEPQLAGPAAPSSARRHSAFGITPRRPVNAAHAQPQLKARQRNFSMPEHPPSPHNSHHSSAEHSFTEYASPTAFTGLASSANFNHNESSTVTASTSPTHPYVRNMSSRLASLAARSGIPKINVDPPLQAPPRPSFTSPETVTAVREKLMAIRRSQPDYKPPSNSGAGFLRMKPQRTPTGVDMQTINFKFRELSFLLEQEVLAPAGSEPGSDLDCAATVETLLAMGADANIYKRAKDTFASKLHLGKNDANIEIPSRYIQDAAERGKANVVWVLASWGAAQQNLNEAYHIAMAKADISILRVLLEHGADTNASQSKLEEFISNGRLEIVQLVLSAPKPVAKECLTRSLKSAVQVGYPEIVELLVAHGADLEYNHAEALMAAVQIGRWDILLRMVLNQSVPSTEISQTHLLTAVNTVMGGSYGPPLRFTLLEILLCAGARGNDLSRALIAAVSEQDHNLVRLLLDFDVDVNYEQAIALRHAVSACMTDIVDVLLTKAPLPDYLNMAFGEIPFASQPEPTIKSLASLLISSGAFGDNVAKLLVQAVRAGYNDLLQLLIDNGTSIEYNNAEALVHAITSVDTRKVITLLKAPINPHHATIAFSAVDMVLEEDVLHELMSLLLARGATGDPVDRALLAAVRKNQWTIITLLLSNGASVGYSNAACLAHAVAQSDDAMLQTLLQHRVSSETASIAFGYLTMETRELYSMAKRLIEAGATGTPLSKLLVASVERRNITIASLLMSGGASVTFNGGQSLRKAVETGDDQIVKILLPGCLGTSGGEVMDIAFTLTDGLADGPRSAIISLFLEAGLRGNAISQALIKEVNKMPINYQIVNDLARRGAADLGASDGFALKSAVRKMDIELLRILLDARPTPGVISDALPLAMDIRRSSTQFDVLELLLGSGATGDEVSIALVKTIRRQPEALGQIDLLLANGADVNFGNAEAIKAAYSSRQLGVFNKLVSAGATQNNMAAIFQLAMDHNDPDWKYNTIEILLQAGLTGPTVDSSLIKLAQQDTKSTRLFSLLLDHKASVDYASGSAMLQCVRQGSIGKLQLLLQHNPSVSVIRDSLQAAMEHSDMAAKEAMVAEILRAHPDMDDINEALIRALEDHPPSERLVTLLLDSGASILHNDGGVLKLAVMGSYFQVLQTLVGRYQGAASELSMINTALFDDAMTAGVWKTEEGLATIKILLAHGASGMCVDKAFAVAAEAYESAPTAKRLVKSLLGTPNANVNREDGLCLQIAAQKANVQLVQLLLQGNPSKRSLSMAFPHIISSGTDETTLMTLARLFLADGQDTDLTFQHPLFGPVLFGTLTKYPNFVQFYELIIGKGADLESKVKAKLESVTENVTPLLWALVQHTQEVGVDVIKCFIQNGADVNFKSEWSLTTPLIVAVQKQKRDVVFELLKAGASVGAEDQKGETALLKASRQGAYDIAELLLARSSSRDDGSLHVAATAGNAAVVKLLIEEGRHDPDFPSSRHRMRSALAQLALEGDAVRNKVRLKDTVRTLLDHQADPLLRTENRSPLIFGLNNKNPVEMTKLLLDAGFYRNLNSDANMYKDENKTMYSPTMYVRQGLCQNQSPEVLEELYQLLKLRGEDKFYIDNPDVPQPVGYVGIPEYLRNAEEERQRLQRIIDNERKLTQERVRTERWEVTERERMRNQEYKASLVRQADMQTREDLRLAKVRAAELAHLQAMSSQKLQIEDYERARVLQHLKQTHQEEQRHQENLNKQELLMIQSRSDADRARQLEIEDASTRDHRRQLEYLQQWGSNLEAQRQIGWGGAGSSAPATAPRQLQWPYTNDDKPD
ncbi:hypothetical protein DRE_04002 [Drechslerella stenobrocha 248]|uniref:Ankyrin repeat containing protein n=1 Tax=Drechslerella stenobrocha 248 TaxID=1043628 RepID=W7I2W2_9PEZI|nr:hypothetical protein DRE_04002 [Drechslerella stenobrocha 248]